MKKILILVALIVFMIVTGAWMVFAQSEDDTSCTTEIINSSVTQCVDGYEWMYKHEKIGCHIYLSPVSQKFEIYPKKSGKPKMMLPVPCVEITPTPIP